MKHSGNPKLALRDLHDALLALAGGDYANIGRRIAAAKDHGGPWVRHFLTGFSADIRIEGPPHKIRKFIHEVLIYAEIDLADQRIAAALKAGDKSAVGFFKL